MRTRLIVILTLFVLVEFACRDSVANDFAQLQSAYLGDGWFQYTLTNLLDPFWQQADLQEFVVPTFASIIAVGTNPVDWQNQASPGLSADWRYTGTPPQARPYQRVFLARSSYTTYRTVTNGAMMTSLEYPQNDLLPAVVETNFKGGYGNFACLVPCPPEQADGSPSNAVSTVKLYPDVTINNMLVISNNLYGFTYSWWSSDYTILVQGSTDLLNWTNIAYALGSPPSSSWTSSVPLSSYGNFFRMELVGTYHLTNLLGQASAPAAPQHASPTITQSSPPHYPMISCTRSNTGDIVIQFYTLGIARTWRLWVTDVSGLQYQQKTVFTTASTASVTFDPTSGPNPGIVHARLLP